MVKRIIFYAPTGKNIELSRVGGAERGVQRTLELLEDKGYETIRVEKPYIENGRINYLFKIFKAVIDLRKLIIEFPDALVYIVGFYEKNIFFEDYLISFAKKKGNKTIYEPKNGRFVRAYEEGKRNYRLKVQNILSNVNNVFCQGSSYVEFVNRFYEEKAIYVPNYVLDRLREPVNQSRPHDIVEIIYFGRVTQTKGIDIALYTVAELVKKGILVRMTIIGGYESTYKEELEEIIGNLSISNVVNFIGPKPFDEIKKYLHNSHYFLFPSNEPDEGHSNSLTEAMAFGVVPIVSNAGFNKEIISDEYLVVSSYNPIDYANCIESIEKENKWDNKSLFVKRRIEECFSEKKVNKELFYTIEKLFEDKDD